MPSNLVLTDVESTASLTGNAHFNGKAHDAHAEQIGFFRVFAASDVAGTLAVQQSSNYNPDTGTGTWYTTKSDAIGADATVGTVVESLVCLRWVRGLVTNGAGAQASLLFATARIGV